MMQWKNQMNFQPIKIDLVVKGWEKFTQNIIFEQIYWPFYHFRNILAYALLYCQTNLLTCINVLDLNFLNFPFSSSC